MKPLVVKRSYLRRSLLLAGNTSIAVYIVILSTEEDLRFFVSINQKEINVAASIRIGDFMNPHYHTLSP